MTGTFASFPGSVECTLPLARHQTAGLQYQSIPVPVGPVPRYMVEALCARFEIEIMRSDCMPCEARC